MIHKEKDIIFTSREMYNKDIDKYPLLTREEERELFKQYHEGDEDARQRLICCNQRLVTKIANSYASNDDDFLEFVSVGNIGLFKAIDKFDITKGLKFSSYAYPAIDRTIIRYMEKNYSSLSVSYNVVDKIKKINNYGSWFYSQYGRYPTRQELAHVFNITLDKLDLILGSRNGVCSLYEKWGIIGDEDDEKDLIDISPDINSPNPADVLIASSLKFDLHAIIDQNLTTDEKQVITMLYGLNNNDMMTSSYIGEKMHISTDKVRQIEYKALRKIRRTSINTLKAYK